MRHTFATYLSRMLEQRGAAAKLAQDSGVSAPQISRIAKGEIIPERDTFNKLVSAMSPQDRNAIAIEYLRYHCPDFTDILISVGDTAENKDRLTLACEKLDLGTREALATILESGSRAPDQLVAWLRSMSAILAPASAQHLALAAESPTPPPVTEPRQPVTYTKRRRK
jgi:hypothetical protein